MIYPLCKRTNETTSQILTDKAFDVEIFRD